MTDRGRRGWYVVRTKLRREGWAAENVARQNAEFYLPKISPKEALFPGYMFVRTPGGVWRFLTGTFGVVGLIMEGERPALLRDEEIVYLKSLEVGDFVVLPKMPEKEPKFKSGEEVVPIEGPLAGFTGLVDSMDGEDRVLVLVNILGAMRTVSFGVDRVRKVPKDRKNR